MQFGTTEKTITLACDPAPEADRTAFTLRSLTAPELQAAREAAGSVPWMGKHLIEQVQARVADGEAEAGIMASMSEEQVQSISEAGAWVQRMHLELACAAVTKVGGREVDDVRAVLTSVRPASLYGPMIGELAGAVNDMSTVDPKG